MWRKMVSNIDRFLPKPSAELGDIGDSDVIQCPQCVLVEGCGALFEPQFNTIGEQVILPDQVFVLNPVVQFRILVLQNQHLWKEARTPWASPRVGLSCGYADSF